MNKLRAATLDIDINARWQRLNPDYFLSTSFNRRYVPPLRQRRFARKLRRQNLNRHEISLIAAVMAPLVGTGRLARAALRQTGPDALQVLTQPPVYSVSNLLLMVARQQSPP